MPQPGWASISLGSQEVHLPNDLVPSRLSHLILLRDPPVQEIPGGYPALTCLKIWSLKGFHASTCSGICQSRGPRRSTCLDLPRDSILGRVICLNLPGKSPSRMLSCLSLLGDLHPDLGMPDFQVTTVLGRINFRKTHP